MPRKEFEKEKDARLQLEVRNSALLSERKQDHADKMARVEAMKKVQFYLYPGSGETAEDSFFKCKKCSGEVYLINGEKDVRDLRLKGYFIFRHCGSTERVTFSDLYENFVEQAKAEASAGE